MKKITHTRHLIVALILAASVLSVYWPVQTFDFVNYDDDIYVVRNDRVQQGLTWDGIGWALTTFETGNWHPLTWVSHMLDVSLYGLNPAGHHWTNLQLHLINTLLLYLLLATATGATWRAGFVAALFAVHPLHVESVAWVAERKDVLSTLFGLIACIAYCRYGRSGRIGMYLLSLLALSFSLMAKPMLVTLPFVFFLFDVWPLKRIDHPVFRHWQKNGYALPLKKVILEKIPFFVPVCISAVLTFMAQSGAGAVVSTGRLPLDVRLSNALVSYWGYLEKTLWPTELVFYYPHPLRLPSATQLGVAAIILIAISLGCVHQFKRRPFLAFGWLWYLGTLVPVIGLVQVGGQAMADRYTYVPLIGVFIAVVWGIHSALAGAKNPLGLRRLSAAGGVLVLVLFALLAARQTYVWSNNRTLYNHCLSVFPDNWLALNNLGVSLLDEDQAAEAVDRFLNANAFGPASAQTDRLPASASVSQPSDEKTIADYRRRLKMDPDRPDVHNALGIALYRDGQIDEAMTHFQQALAIDADYAAAHGNLANVLYVRGELTMAESHYGEAIRLDPKLVDAHYNLGRLLVHQGQIDNAIRCVAAAVRLKPDHAPALLQLGMLFAAKKKVALARQFVDRALRVNPDFERARRWASHLKNIIARETEDGRWEIVHATANMEKP